MDWQERYETNDTPWARGEASPPLIEFSSRYAFLNQRILVPGCGLGHDAAYLASLGASVLGVDLSSLAVQKAQSLHKGFEGKLSFQCSDFLDLRSELPSGAFDMLFEHTCFCAIEPERRTDYVKAAHRVLKPGGQLLGVFFTHLPDPGNPPYQTSPEAIAAYFATHFEIVEQHRPQSSFPGREGEESFYAMVRK